MELYVEVPGKYDLGKKIYMYKYIYIYESYYPTSKVNHQFEITKVVNITIAIGVHARCIELVISWMN